MQPVQSLRQRVDGDLARLAVTDHLGDHRIIEERDLVALAHTTVDAQFPFAQLALGRFQEVFEAPDGGQEAAIGIFRIQPRFPPPSLPAEPPTA